MKEMKRDERDERDERAKSNTANPRNEVDLVTLVELSDSMMFSVCYLQTKMELTVSGTCLTPIWEQWEATRSPQVDKLRAELELVLSSQEICETSG